MRKHNPPLFEKKALSSVQNVIAHKILLYIVVFSSFITLIITAVQLHSDYKHQTIMIENRMVQIEKSYRDSLSNSIWYLNDRQINSILTGIMEFDDVNYVSVEINDGTIYNLGKRRKDVNFRDYNTSITHDVENNSIVVGKLSIESNLDGVIERLGNKFWLILIAQTLKTFLVSLFVLSIIYYLVTRHLSKIAFFASTLDINRKEEFLELERPRQDKEDEFDLICHTMNEMKESLILDEEKRKETELKLKKLSQAVEQSSASILIMDVNGHIEYVNPKFEDSTGYNLQDIAGKKSDTLSFGEKSPQDYHAIWLSIKSGSKWRGELCSRRKDGSQFWEAAAVSSITDESQNITHYLVMKDDISELRQTEQNLRHAQKMEAIGHITGGIAHDFNNILGIAMGNLELANTGMKKDDPAVIRIDKALTAINRAAELTRKLLHFARKKAGETESILINTSIANMDVLISKSLSMPIEVKITLADDLWKVKANPGELEDSILNLSLNARDAMPEGGMLSIETSNRVLDHDFLQLHSHAKTGDYVMLSVSDTGVGMTEAVKEQCFQPFYTTKEFSKGTGLGLSMVYGFVERSGGFIIVDTQLGQGTQIQLFLPRIRTEKSVTLTTKPVISALTGTNTILVVDDEEELLETTSSYLQQLGYKVLATSNAREALSIIESEQRVDLLLTDIVMPSDLDGYQLAIKTNNIAPSIKIILTSGFKENVTLKTYNENELINQLTKNILNKPFDLSELSLAVSKSLTLEEE